MGLDLNEADLIRRNIVEPTLDGMREHMRSEFQPFLEDLKGIKAQVNDHGSKIDAMQVMVKRHEVYLRPFIYCASLLASVALGLAAVLRARIGRFFRG